MKRRMAYMICVSNISFAFENCKVLKDVSFSCESGRIVGLVGINGAGKSTLLRLMSGVYEIEGGSIEYDGRKPSEEKLKGQLFFLPDDPYYTTHATAKSIFDMYKVFYPNLIYDEFYSAMSTLNLDMTKGVRSFSKGMRRQLYVALAFAIKPKYLLMDETFDGLDPLAREAFKNQAKEMVKSSGMTILISSHSLLEVEDFCDETIMIDTGRIVTSEELKTKDSGVRKFNMAFTEGTACVTAIAALKQIGASKIESEGRFINVIVRSDIPEIESKIKALNATVLEEVSPSLSETFIFDVKHNSSVTEVNK